ncbi:hypothetical protein MATL_G00203540 [Megalops atlanticus]|uniref:Uncharacterized protein n=1 Tax=Megalops atlanticus TaxID=7932 RepID=A0A9D3PK26_MEGAT|nr:hypothetical protein MATL_G00203540 [Megalops atlanticus]
MAACMSPLPARYLIRLFIKKTALPENKKWCRPKSISRGYTSNAEIRANSTTIGTQNVSSATRERGLLEHYHSLTAAGTLREDNQQRDVVKQLDQLQIVMREYCIRHVAFQSKVRTDHNTQDLESTTTEQEPIDTEKESFSEQ